MARKIRKEERERRKAKQGDSLDNCVSVSVCAAVINKDDVNSIVEFAAHQTSISASLAVPDVM